MGPGLLGDSRPDQWRGNGTPEVDWLAFGGDDPDDYPDGAPDAVA